MMDNRKALIEEARRLMTEKVRSLASRREDLIARGVDPSRLSEVPRLPWDTEA